MRRRWWAAAAIAFLIGCPTQREGASSDPMGSTMDPVKTVPRAYEDALKARTKSAERAVEAATGEPREAPKGSWKRTGKAWGGGKKWGGGKPWGK